MGSQTAKILGRLVHDPDEYRLGCWPETPSVHGGAAHGRFGDLFGIEELSRLLLQEGLPADRVQMAKDGSSVPRNDLRQGPAPGEMPSSDRNVDGRTVGRWLNAGYTLIVNSVDSLSPALSAFCGGLALELGRRVGANAYLTPPSSAGLGTHYDDHDSVIVQVAGSKKWRVFGHDKRVIVGSGPANVKLRHNSRTLIDTVLEEGQTLFIPRGFIHDARCADSFSLHLTIGILPE